MADGIGKVQSYTTDCKKCDKTPCQCGNPFDEIKKNLLRGSRFFGFDDIPNPILKEVSEKNEVYKDTFRLIDMAVPYFGDNINSAHGFLEWYMGLIDTSTTQSMCWQARKKSAFGGKIRLLEGDSEFDTGKEAADPISDINPFKEFLEDVEIELDSLIELSRCMFDNIYFSGNIYVEVEIRQVKIGESTKSRAFIYLHESLHCVYLRTKREEAKLIAISPFWCSYDRLAESNTVVLPVFPEIEEQGSGATKTIRTIFHFRNKVPNRRFYGLPDSMASFIDQYRERQDKMYLCKESANGWTGRTVIEVEESSKPEEDEDLAEHMAQTFTNKGKGKSFVFSTRPADATPIVVKNLPANTNEKFYETTQAIHERSIIGSNQLSKVYLGIESAKGGQGNNAYEQEVERININVTEPDQNKIGSAITKILRFCSEYVGFEEMKNLRIDFTNPVMDEIRAKNESINNSSGDSGEGADIGGLSE